MLLCHLSRFLELKKFNQSRPLNMQFYVHDMGEGKTDELFQNNVLQPINIIPSLLYNKVYSCLTLK